MARQGIVNRMKESLRVELFPRDLESSVSFYTEILGFRVDRDDRDRATNYVSLVRGTVRLGLGSGPKEPSSPTLARWSVEIVLEVDDIDAEYVRAQSAGLEVDTALGLRPWGLRDFRCFDPDGNYWRVTSR